MNVAFFLQPKSMVAYLFSDYTLRKGLARLKESGYTALPVLSRDGKFLGVVSEGDFLWYLADRDLRADALGDAKVADITHTDRMKPVPVTTSMDDLLRTAAAQNFVPVVDDSGSFIGIVRRSDIIHYFAKNVNVETPVGVSGI